MSITDNYRLHCQENMWTVVDIEKTTKSAASGLNVSGGSRISRGGESTTWEGVFTPEVVMFQKFCRSKRKNLEP